MGRGLSHPQTTREFKIILKIGQYLTKLCVDYSDLLSLAHPVYSHWGYIQDSS